MTVGTGDVHTLTEGSLVAGYRIEEVAGRGGMGVLYLATQLSLDRTVALKVIRPDLATDPGFRERFVLESRTAASIDHPNVLPIYDAAEVDGFLYIAMRYVDGVDLGKAIAHQGAFQLDRAIHIVKQVAAALDAAHVRGLVHRDVKPANVLTTRPEGMEHVYLSDFGLVKRSASTGALTRTGDWVGTLDYVAPEQLKGDPVDARADVYALGCLLYELLAGEVPFPRDRDVAKLWAHIGDLPPSLLERVAAPLELDQVITKAMAKNPAERYATAGELAQSAAEALSDHMVEPRGTASERVDPSRARHAAASRPLAQAGEASIPGAPRPRSPRLAWPSPRAARAALVAGALAALLGAAGLTLIAPNGGKKAQSNPAGRVFGLPIPVGSSPSDVAVGAGAVWVTNTDDGTVSRIDPQLAATIGAPIRVGQKPGFLAVNGTAVWVTNTQSGTVSRIDPRSNKVVKTIILGGAPVGIAAGESAVWVVDAQNGAVIRIDPATNKIASPPIPVGHLPFGIAVGAGAVWVTNGDDNTLTKIDPLTNKVVGGPLFVGTQPAEVAVGEGAVWIANGKDDTIVQVNPRSVKVVGSAISVGRFPQGLTVGLGSVWISNEDAATVTRVDARTGRVVGSEISVGKAPNGLAVGAGAVWVPNTDANTVTRIAP